MANTKNPRSAAAQRSRSQSHKKVSWLKKRDEGVPALIAILCAVGVLAVLGGYFLQRSNIAGSPAKQAESAIVLNEVMSDNTLTLVTEDGEVPDWIEIANTCSESVNLQA